MNYPPGLGADEFLHLATSPLLRAISVDDYACAIVGYGRGRRARCLQSSALAVWVKF
jgi:hypothetical protein